MGEGSRGEAETRLRGAREIPRSFPESALEHRGQDLEVAAMTRSAELPTASTKNEELSSAGGLAGLLNRGALSKNRASFTLAVSDTENGYSVILVSREEQAK